MTKPTTDELITMLESIMDPADVKRARAEAQKRIAWKYVERARANTASPLDFIEALTIVMKQGLKLFIAETADNENEARLCIEAIMADIPASLRKELEAFLPSFAKAKADLKAARAKKTPFTSTSTH